MCCFYVAVIGAFTPRGPNFFDFDIRAASDMGVSTVLSKYANYIGIHDWPRARVQMCSFAIVLICDVLKNLTHEFRSIEYFIIFE